MDKKEFVFNYAMIDKRIDEMYKKTAIKFGLNNIEMWVLYYIYANDHSMTQSELCDIVISPKQTINASVKNLILKDLIFFENGNIRKNKKINLTEKGFDFCKNTVEVLLDTEINAMQVLSDNEKELYYNLRLKTANEFEKLLKEKGIID